MSCEVLILMLDIDTYVQEVTDVWGDGVVCGPRSYITRGGGGGGRDPGGAQTVAPFVETDSILLFVTDVNTQELAEPDEGQEDEEERWESKTVLRMTMTMPERLLTTTKPNSTRTPASSALWVVIQT